MREDFEKLAAAGKIERAHVESLVLLAQSGFCLHRSWGFGRIKNVDTVFARFVIDFQTKAGHTMDLAFAAESLKAINEKHILARKTTDLDTLRQMAGGQHLGLIKLALESFGGRATLDQIQQVLVPDVVRDDWKKWWETAKREMKKDGHFQVPAKKSEPILYQAAETTLRDRLLVEFRAAKGLKAKVNAATDALKSFPDLDDRAAVATAMIDAMNSEIPSHQRTQPGVALEAVFVRGELRAAAGLTGTDAEVTEATIWSQDHVRISAILDQVPAARHARVLQSFREANPALWHEALLVNINTMPAKVVGECADLLIEHGKQAQFKESLAGLISRHTASTELLLWLAKKRSDAFADILGPEVFRAMLTAMERDQFNERKSNRLRDYIMSDSDLLVELIGSADLEVIKDLTRALQLSPCFDDMDKRSLLARIVKSYPAIQSLITGESAKQETSLLVSWDSLEKRKNEYAELVQKKIPANSKEIAIARSYGDLRENHEYKAAKEMQKILMRRKAELETDLLRARGTDFSTATTEAVAAGTTVHATDLGSGQKESFAIVGAWDGDPDRGMISYLTPLAKAFIGHKPGEEVSFSGDGVKRNFRIESIDAIHPPTPSA